MWLVSGELQDYSWDVIPCTSEEEANSMAEDLTSSYEYRRVHVSQVLHTQTCRPGTFTYLKKYYPKA